MKELLNSPSCLVSTITLAGIKSFGLDSLEVQPEILRDMVQQRFQLGKMSQRSFDKLNCGYSMIGTNLYTASIQGFLMCNSVMANKPLDSDKIAYNNMQDIAWGIWEYCNLLGDLDKGAPTEDFCPQIIVYIQQVAKAQGIRVFPSWLAFAQLNQPYPQALAGDPYTYQAYMQRQQAQCNKLITFVTHKQQLLLDQLKQLKDA